MKSSKSVFISGASGFVGRNLIPLLVSRGWMVKALVRAGSESKIPHGCEVIVGDPLDANSYESRIEQGDIFIQLLGVTHPSPAKKNQFRDIDLKAGLGSVEAAKNAGVSHFVYLSVVLQPAPIMKTYQAVRAQVEESIRQNNLNATILRPWYILGPGRRWPIFLLPIYWLLELFPSTRDSAQRLGFVTIDEMVQSIYVSLENPPTGIRILDVPAIKRN